MAIPFNTSTFGDVPQMKPGMTGGSAIGYVQSTTVDPSILDQMKAAGLQITATSYTSEYAKTAFRPTQLEVLPGKLVPAYYDQAGTNYVINGNDGRVFLVTLSPVAPDGTTSTGGSAGTMMMATGQAPVVGGVLQSPPQSQQAFATPAISAASTPQMQAAQMQLAAGAGLGSGKIYSAFNYDDIIPNQQEVVTRAMWSNGVDTLETTTMISSSLQTDAQKQYYIEVFNTASAADCVAEPQFSVAIGNIDGSGSAASSGSVDDSPFRAVYNQYRLLCLDSDETQFQISGSTETICVVNINRARMREAIDEGNWEITLNGKTFIDDSSVNPATIKQASEVYNIVSGSLANGVLTPDTPVIVGQLFKRKGILVFDYDALTGAGGVSLSLTLTEPQTAASSLGPNNITAWFTLVQGGNSFTARSAEKVKSTHFFVRAKNADYNFSNNPTFVSGSEGELLHPEMYNDPRVYITSVGLYNLNRDLVAVAKMSQPIQKSFKEEALIKIKLDF